MCLVLQKDHAEEKERELCSEVQRIKEELGKQKPANDGTMTLFNGLFSPPTQHATGP